MSEQSGSSVGQMNTAFDEQIWLAEQKQWRLHLKQHLEERLDWTVQYIQQQPHLSTLATRFASIMALLQQACRQLGSQMMTIELILLLHPWPVRWGHWVEWEQMLRFAIEIIQHLPQKKRLAELLEDLAGILHYTGRWEEALAICTQAISAAEQSCDALYLVSASGTAATTLKLMGRAAEAITLLQQLEGHAVIQNAGQAAALAATAQNKLFKMDFLRGQGHLQEALTSGEEALRALGQLPVANHFLHASAHRNYGLIVYVMGHYSEAIMHLQQAQAIFHVLNDAFSETLAQGNLGLVYWAMGDLDRAETAITQALQINEQLNAQWRIVKETGNLAIVYLLRGRLTNAISCVNRHLLLAEQFAVKSEMQRAIGNRGIINLHLSRLAEARRDLEEEATYLIASKGSIEGLVINYVNMGRYYVLLGNLPAAQQLGEQARQLAEQTTATPLRILALRCLAECQPERTEQQGLLEEAFALAEQLGRRFDKAACLFTIAGLATDTAKRDRLWQQGVHLLTEMGAEQWLTGCSLAAPPRLPLMT